MSARPISPAVEVCESGDDAEWRLQPMQQADLPAILVIENAVYSHPWTRGNFVDALASGYDSRVLRNRQHMVIGYFLLMPAVDEMHLLNLSVHHDWQGRGIGRMLLAESVLLARRRHMDSLLLEVRPSNLRALQLYRHFGFIKVGTRHGYYPAADNQREDAIVMRYLL